MQIPLSTTFGIEPKKVVFYGAVANGSEQWKPPKTDDDSHYFVDANGNLQRQSGGIHWFVFVAGLFIVADVKS